jgi:hypothetical protein
MIRPYNRKLFIKKGLRKFLEPVVLIIPSFIFASLPLINFFMGNDLSVNQYEKWILGLVIYLPLLCMMKIKHEPIHKKYIDLAGGKGYIIKDCCLDISKHKFKIDDYIIGLKAPFEFYKKILIFAILPIFFVGYWYILLYISIIGYAFGSCRIDLAQIKFLNKKYKSGFYNNTYDFHVSMMIKENENNEPIGSNGFKVHYTIADLKDATGLTNRDCPICGKKLYNDVDMSKPEHDFCGICGYNCFD